MLDLLNGDNDAGDGSAPTGTARPARPSLDNSRHMWKMCTRVELTGAPASTVDESDGVREAVRTSS